MTFDLDLGVKIEQNVAQYSLHHVTYAATKFEVAKSNGLGGDAFAKKYIINSHQFFFATPEFGKITSSF